MAEPQDDYDSPWKGAIEAYFQDFMAFLFPEAHDDIDWTSAATPGRRSSICFASSTG